MASLFYIVGPLFALAITGGAVYALAWAFRSGQMKNFDQGAKVIFDEEEPEGELTDSFPGKKKKTSASSSPKAKAQNS